MNVETEIITALITGLFALVTTIGGYTVGKLKEQTQRDKGTERAIADGVKVLLSCQLTNQFERYVNEGSIDLEGVDEVRRVYNAYHALGGNGVGTEKAAAIERLPRRNGTP